MIARQASQVSSQARVSASMPSKRASWPSVVEGNTFGREIVSQNSRSAAMRFSGGLPAMIAVLNAPMEMPAIQFGAMPASNRPW